MSEGEQGEKHIVILGMTEGGKKFRPSDWAERLAGSANIFVDKASDKAYVATIDGVAALKIPMTARVDHPEAHDFIMGFAKSNRLVVEEEIQKLQESKNHGKISSPKF